LPLSLKEVDFELRNVKCEAVRDSASTSSQAAYARRTGVHLSIESLHRWKNCSYFS